MHEDAERLAQRFHETQETLALRILSKDQQRPRVRWEDVPDENKQLMIAVVDEMLQAQLIFPGPSLYSAGDFA